jgi:hypothetical protein
MTEVATRRSDGSPVQVAFVDGVPLAEWPYWAQKNLSLYLDCPKWVAESLKKSLDPDKIIWAVQGEGFVDLYESSEEFLAAYEV